MTEYTVVRGYPYPIEEVWAVLTDPELVAQWTTTGQGGRPEGFAAVAGTRFRFVGKPTIGWAGVVYCEVLDVEAPRALRYTWKGDQDSGDGPGDERRERTLEVGEVVRREVHRDDGVAFEDQ